MSEPHCVLVLLQTLIGFYQDSLISKMKVLPHPVKQVLISLNFLFVEILGIGIDDCDG